MAESFELLDLDRPDDFSRLLDKISSTFEQDRGPSLEIIQLMRKQNVKSVIVEYNYIDIDYRDEFAHFYSLTLKPHKGTCTRLHFFDRASSHDDLFCLSDFNEHYIGYCIVRPTAAFRIGRTVIRPLNEGTKDSYFILCKARYEVNICGQQLFIEGMPFIQQDTQVAACAQASLWMALRYLSKRLGLQEYSPFAITEQATRHVIFERPIPTSGLIEIQMVEALRGIGYSPLCYSQESFTLTEWGKKRVEFIYRYIESELPVILILSLPGGRHAVTAIGHTFDYSAKIRRSGTHYNSVQWVKEFIIHDDARGPYQIMPLKASTDSYSIENVESVIIPLPQTVYMRGEDAESVAIFWLERLREALNDPSTVKSRMMKETVELLRQIAEINEFTKQFLFSLRNRELVIRTYLRPSNNYKISLQASKIAKELKEAYWEKRMSKYIWVTEISTKEIFAQELVENRLMLGEILIDSTANGFTPSWLSIHLPGLCLIRNVETESTELVPLPDDEPYRHLAR